MDGVREAPSAMVGYTAESLDQHHHRAADHQHHRPSPHHRTPPASTAVTTPTARSNRVESTVREMPSPTGVVGGYPGDAREQPRTQPRSATQQSGRVEVAAAAAAAAAVARGSAGALTEAQSSARRRNHTKSIGHYILGKTIGEGTFGKVKLGTHILTGEKVAVKVLEKERIIDVADVERVAREVYILKLIRHQHVVQLYEIIETSRQLYLIMEYASGGELFDYIVACGRIQEPEACRFFRQIIEGVEEIHKMNVVHRDLKPENLLLDEHRHIKIVDFGLSNTYRDGQLLKTACGSPCYAAPEMIAGKEYVPSLCDIWSCGVILFAMLCGYLPFEDQNTAALYRKILAAEYTLPDFLSQGARELITGMLTTDPVRRLTAAQIRQQQWFNLSPEESARGVHNQQVLHFEEDILEELEKFGFPPDYTQRCLKMNKHNHVTTTYHLLAQKKLRLMDQVMMDPTGAGAALGQESPGAGQYLSSNNDPPVSGSRIGGGAGGSPPYDRDFGASDAGEEISNSGSGTGGRGSAYGHAPPGSPSMDGGSASGRGTQPSPRGPYVGPGSGRTGGSPGRTEPGSRTGGAGGAGGGGSPAVAAWPPQAGMQVRDMRDVHMRNPYMANESLGAAMRTPGDQSSQGPQATGPPSPRTTSQQGSTQTGTAPTQPRWAVPGAFSSRPSAGAASPTPATSPTRPDSPGQVGTGTHGSTSSSAASRRQPRSDLTGTPRGPRGPSADRLGKSTPGGDHPSSSPSGGGASEKEERSGGGTSSGLTGPAVGPTVPPPVAQGDQAPRSARSSNGGTNSNAGNIGNSPTTSTSSTGGSRPGVGTGGAVGSGASGINPGQTRSGRLPSPPRFNKNSTTSGPPSSVRPLNLSGVAPSANRGSVPPNSARGGSSSLSARAAYSMSARSQTPESTSRHQTPSRGSMSARESGAGTKKSPLPGTGGPSQPAASQQQSSAQQTPLQTPPGQEQPQTPLSQQPAQRPGMQPSPQSGAERQHSAPQPGQQSGSSGQAGQQSGSQTERQQSGPAATGLGAPQNTPLQSGSSRTEASSGLTGPSPMQAPPPSNPLSALGQSQNQSTAPSTTVPGLRSSAAASLRTGRPYPTAGDSTTPRTDLTSPRGQPSMPTSISPRGQQSSGPGPAGPAGSGHGPPRWPERPGSTPGSTAPSSMGPSAVGPLGLPGTSAGSAPSSSPSPVGPLGGQDRPLSSRLGPTTDDRPLSSRVAPTTDLEASLPSTFAPLSARDSATAPLSSREAREDRRAAVDTLRTSSRPPRLIMQELQRVMGAQRIASKQVNPLTLRCQWLSLKFDVEVAPLDRLGSIHAVRSRRTAGEPWQYKDVCNRLLAELRIA